METKDIVLELRTKNGLSQDELAKKIKTFLITLDIEKNDSYDYDYYEDEYEDNGDEQDFSEYSGEEE